jgi:hypothetical protein
MDPEQFDDEAILASRAVTRPHVFDPATVEAEWAAWHAREHPTALAPEDSWEENAKTGLHLPRVSTR